MLIRWFTNWNITKYNRNPKEGIFHNLETQKLLLSIAYNWLTKKSYSLINKLIIKP